MHHDVTCASPSAAALLAWAALSWLCVLFAFVAMTMAVHAELCYYKDSIEASKERLHDVTTLEHYFNKYCELMDATKHLEKMLSM